MRWLVLVMTTAACTADNPEFDLADTNGMSSGSDAGDELGSTGRVDTSDAEDGDGTSTGSIAECGPFDDDRDVELRVDEIVQCGLFFAVGGIELIDGNKLHLRCSDDEDSQCPPGSLVVLSNAWGFPEELVADPQRMLQLQYDTSGDCHFAQVAIQAESKTRLQFIALGPGGIFQPITDYEVTAHSVETCDCSNDCCDLPAGTYALEKSLVGESLVLGEGEEADAELDGAVYGFHNFASHVDASCAKVFHWQAVLR